MIFAHCAPFDEWIAMSRLLGMQPLKPTWSWYTCNQYVKL
jgi:hypothetical protein